MDDMNAKELFRKNVSEADEPGRPPGPPPEGGPPRRSLKLSGQMRRVPFRPPGSEMGEEDMPPEDIARMTGRGGPPEPRGQFSGKELSQLKDVLIMILAGMAHSDMDAQIGAKLMAGEELDPGQLQHILDEARNVQIPESHGQLLQKIFSKLQGQ